MKTVRINKKLEAYQFFCDSCETIHTKSAYAIAQKVMNVELVFTCKCGNKIYL